MLNDVREQKPAHGGLAHTASLQTAWLPRLFGAALPYFKTTGTWKYFAARRSSVPSAFNCLMA